MDISTLTAFLNTQTLDQLKAINNIVVARINAADGGTGFRRPSVTAALAAFKVGDLVDFTDKRGTKHRARISSVNSKTCSCTELHTGAKWRVSPSFLRLVGADDATKSPAPAPTLPSDWPFAGKPELFTPDAPKIDAAKPTAAHAGGW